MSFVSLQIKGIIHINNIEHLKLVPTSHLCEEQYLVQILKTILENCENSKGKCFMIVDEIPIDELAEKFKFWTKTDLSMCYQLYEAFGIVNMDLFRRYPEYFEVTPDMSAMLKLKPNEVREGKYPISFPKEYFAKTYKAFGKPQLLLESDIKLVSMVPCQKEEGVTPMEDTECIIIDD